MFCLPHNGYRSSHIDSYQGYLPQSGYQKSLQKIAGWSIPKDTSNGPVYPASYKTPDIICHVGAMPGAASVKVAAGHTVELQWTPWPATHHGPVIDYLADCNGPCGEVDKTKLRFNKIDATGLLRNSVAAGQAGYWAADKLRQANNSWTVTMPPSIAPGSYILRHEIIALHDARTVNGAQNYPHCINLEVTGVGKDKLATGTLGTSLYRETDPGIFIDIYRPLTYTMPGPPLYVPGNSAAVLDDEAPPLEDSSAGGKETHSVTKALAADTTPMSTRPVFHFPQEGAAAFADMKAAMPLAPSRPWANSSTTKAAEIEAYSQSRTTLSSPPAATSTSLADLDSGQPV